MSQSKFSRRHFLHIAGVAGITALAGCGSDDSDQDGGADPTDTDPQSGGNNEFLDDEPDYGGYLEGANGYEGTRDLRDQDTVTVKVGDGDGLSFGPAAIAVSQGTTVQFKWTGEGGQHNVKRNEGPASLDSGSAVDTSGVEYEYTVEETGTTTYYCDPHEAIGMKGGIHVV